MGAGVGPKGKVTAPHSSWQNAYVERLIGSIRRECLDHVIVLNVICGGCYKATRILPHRRANFVTGF